MSDNDARARELAKAFGFEPHVFSDEKSVVLKDTAYAKACDQLAALLGWALSGRDTSA